MADETFGFGKYRHTEDNRRFEMEEKKGQWYYPPVEPNVTEHEFYLDPSYAKETAQLVATIKHPEVFGTEFPAHFLFVGLYGTGKTHYARYIATLTGSDFVPVKGFPNPDFVSILFNEARERAKEKHQILFLDELEKVGSREDIQDDFKVEKLSRLLQEMDSTDSNYNITVIGAANKPEMIDEALRRGGGRIGDEIEFYSLPPAGRCHVLRLMAHNLSYEVLKEKNPSKKGHMFKVQDDLLEHLAQVTHGYTNGDLKEVLLKAFKYAFIDHERLSVNADDLQMALTKIKPSALKDLPLKTPRITIDDLVGMEDHVQMIRDYIGETYAHDSPGKTLMFYGGTGLGKSALAEALAAMYGINFLSVSGAELLDGLIGKTNKDIDKILTRASHHRPTLLLFDEFHALFKTKGYQSFKDTWTGQFHSRLNYLPEGVIIIATLPHPAILDDQTVERFVKCVPFYEPTIENLEAAWKHYLGANGYDYHALAVVSEHMNYRSIKRIANAVATHAHLKPNQNTLLYLINSEKKIEQSAPRDDLAPYVALVNAGR